jgi:integrase/recombinase XerC
MEYVIPGKKRKDGKRSPYRGRYRLSPDEEFREVPLHTTDKQIARKRLREIVQEKEQERAGFIRPKREREAIACALHNHIEAFIAERYDVGRDEKYVRELRKKLLVLAAEVPWKFIADITPESFCSWRRKQKKSPKTLNDYLSSIGGLLNWLEPVIGQNRLRFVQRMQTAVEPTRQRRASSVADLRRLIVAAGGRGIIYLVAASTGIRRGELRSLEWRDVVLDMPQPFIFVRRSIAKNHTTTKQPLPEYVARELEKFRPIDFRQNERVFRSGIPDMDTFRRDLERAGIPYRDEQGRYADFHSLRTTFSTLLAVFGIAERIRMELNRHSDPKLTAKTYTDASVLPVSEAIGLLPLLVDAKSDSHIHSHKLVPESPNVSAPVPIEPGKPILLTAGNEVVSPSESAFVPQSPEVEKSAPCRNRTCNPLIKSQLLCQLS